MSRSKWKGPFLNFLEKDAKRSCEILPIFVNKSFYIHNGINKKEITVLKDLIGHKFGEFFFTRTSNVLKKKSKKKSSLKKK